MTLRRHLERRIQHYIVLKTFISLCVGALVGFALAIIGVDLAFVFAIITFMLNFIPNVGSIIATLLPLPLVLLDPDADWGKVQLIFLNNLNME